MKLDTPFQLGEKEINWMESFLDDIQKPQDLKDFMSVSIPFPNKAHGKVKMYLTDRPMKEPFLRLSHTTQLFWKTFYFYIYDERERKRGLLWAKNPAGQIKVLSE